MVLAIYKIILHLYKITECLKITTFKIVFTLDVFFSAETTMHCKVTCILYKKQAHFSQLFPVQLPVLVGHVTSICLQIVIYRHGMCFRVSSVFTLSILF
jgi:hypothetical protein